MLTENVPPPTTNERKDGYVSYELYHRILIIKTGLRHLHQQPMKERLPHVRTKTRDLPVAGSAGREIVVGKLRENGSCHD